MPESARMLLAGIFTVLGLGWFLAVEVWRGRTQDNSPRVFWLHLTAPVVAILFLISAMLLLLNSDHVRRARGGHQRRALELRLLTIDPLANGRVFRAILRAAIDEAFAVEHLFGWHRLLAGEKSLNQ